MPLKPRVIRQNFPRGQPVRRAPQRVGLVSEQHRRQADAIAAQQLPHLRPILMRHYEVPPIGN